MIHFRFKRTKSFLKFWSFLLSLNLLKLGSIKLWNVGRLKIRILDTEIFIMEIFASRKTLNPKIESVKTGKCQQSFVSLLILISDFIPAEHKVRTNQIIFRRINSNSTWFTTFCYWRTPTNQNLSVKLDILWTP